MGSPVTPLTIPEEITTLGGAIRWARRQRGWKVSELAFLVGMSAKVVQNIEYGLQRTARVARFEDELELELAHLPVAKVKILRAEREPVVGGRPRKHGARRKFRPAATVVETQELEHTRRERELVAGECGESTHCFKGCNFCHEMPWRRRPGGCRGCGEMYAPEPSVRAESTPQSSAGYAAERA